MLDPKIAHIPWSVFQEASGEAGRTRSPISHPLSCPFSPTSHSLFTNISVWGLFLSCLHAISYFFLYSQPPAPSFFLLFTTTFNHCGLLSVIGSIYNTKDFCAWRIMRKISLFVSVAAISFIRAYLSLRVRNKSQFAWSHNSKLKIGMSVNKKIWLLLKTQINQLAI